jgi:branched-chain amino acid aminotransferase
MQDNYCYFNQQILPFSELSLRFNDLSILRGFGIFDYLRTYQGIPFRIRHYLQRFSNSAQSLELQLPISQEAIEELIEELLFLRVEKSDDVGIRLLLTGGYSSDSVHSEIPNLFIGIEHLHTFKPELYSEGIKVITYSHQRYIPEIKSTSYLPVYATAKKLREAQAQDLLYHSSGKISECTRSNFFMIRGNTLITPKDGVLMGITRHTILELAKDYLEIEERDVSIEELSQADECFKTSSSQLIVPVVQIDDRLINQGKVGAKTFQIQKLFAQYTSQV